MRGLFFGFCLSLSTAFANADDAADAGAKVHEYFVAFNSQDVQKIANEIYSTPVHIGGGGGHRVMATPEDAVENLIGPNVEFVFCFSTIPWRPQGP